MDLQAEMATGNPAADPVDAAPKPTEQGDSPDGKSQKPTGSEANADQDGEQGSPDGTEGQSSSKQDDNSAEAEGKRIKDLQSSFHQEQAKVESLNKELTEADDRYKEAMKKVDDLQQGKFDDPEDAPWKKDDYQPEHYGEVVDIATKRARDSIRAEDKAQEVAQKAAHELMQAQHAVIKAKNSNAPDLKTLTELGVKYKVQDIDSAYEIWKDVQGTKAATEKETAENVLKRQTDTTAGAAAAPGGGGGEGGPSFEEIQEADSVVDVLHRHNKI